MTLLIDQYIRLSHDGSLQHDPNQIIVLEQLAHIKQQLETPQPKGLLSILKFKKRRAKSARGLYIYGSIGTGKTFLMDLFYDALRDGIPKKRYHFHGFMIYVHDQIKNFSKSPAPFHALAEKISTQTRVLCLDEFHVTDIADAMILERLFKAIIDAGTIVVMTSNVHPDDIYFGGLYRERVLPFMDYLKTHLDVTCLDSGIDYRQRFLESTQKYYTTGHKKDLQALNDIFATLSKNEPIQKTHLPVKDREVVIEKTAGGVAWIDFNDLCAKPLSASDYMTISEHFHSIILTDIPVLEEDQFNEAKRFITFIDVIYDKGNHLIVQASAPPDQIYLRGRHSDLFKRTASRLVEMTQKRKQE
jgi:cell division protein ZapE